MLPIRRPSIATAVAAALEVMQRRNPESEAYLNQKQKKASKPSETGANAQDIML